MADGAPRKAASLVTSVAPPDCCGWGRQAPRTAEELVQRGRTGLLRPLEGSCLS